MNERTKTGLEILEAAVLLGLLGDALLRATPWGLNVLLWVGTLAAAMAALTLRRRREFWTRENAALHGAVLVFAGFMAWRDSLTLQTLDVLIILALLSILSLPALNLKTHLASVSQYLLAAVNSLCNAMIAPLLLVLGDIEWKTIPRRGWTKHLISILRGLAIAAPLVLIFGALFMAADAVFENIVNNTLNIKPEIVFGHVLLFGFLAWIGGGYLRGAMFGSVLSNSWTTDFPVTPSVVPNSNQPAVSVVHDSAETAGNPKTVLPINENTTTIFKLPEFLRLGAVEIGIVLGLMNLLFLSFVIIQLRYFFGGMDFVQTTENFKLADYARRGFFELCWVAALVLPILMTAHFLLKKQDAIAVKLFRTLAVAQIGLLFIIMFSAVNRMLLYTGELGYGMTEMRFYPTAFMLWLALVFVWFGLTVLRGHYQHFAWGALWTALFIVAGLHVLNPDNFIVRHNAKLMQQGRTFDADYMINLSDDAVPALTQTLPQMPFDEQCRVKNQFLRRLDEFSGSDFRTFNLSRWTGRQVLLNAQNELETNGCPEWMTKTYRDNSQDADKNHF